jgi:ankyrin repeat protein
MLQPLFPSSNVSGSHPDGRYVQNEYGDIPLHFALRHPCTVCFRAVLHSGNVDVTTMQDLNEETALHLSTEKNVLVLLYCGSCFVTTVSVSLFRAFVV